MTGRVILTTGSWYEVLTDNGSIIKCRLRGKLKLEEMKSTNPVAVGDLVDIATDDITLDYCIEGIHVRKNYIVRQSPRQKFAKHILAANIDCLLIVACVSKPRTSLGFIDRCIIAAECFHIPVKIIINKSDTHKEKDNRVGEEWIRLYRNIGYDIMTTSVVSGENLQLLKTEMSHRTTLIAGHSGVGKSSLLNALSPHLQLRTQKISDKWNKGQHTTTFATMYVLDDDIFVIDTPGIKEFFVIEIEPMELGGYFKEFLPYMSQCVYNDCLHKDEKNCAVKQAVHDGNIHPERYINYLNILEQIQNVKYWERM